MTNRLPEVPTRSPSGPPDYVGEPGSIRYYVAFDCLAGAEPQLAGFARYAPRQRDAVQTLEERWRWRMMDRRCNDEDAGIGTAAELLDRAGFDGGALSLFWRYATADECAAFDQVARTVRASLRCLVLDSEGIWRAVRAHGTSIPGAKITLPQVLANATLPLPVLPKIFFHPQCTVDGLTLADAIDGLPTEQRSLTRQRLIDASGTAAKPVQVFPVRAASATPAATLLNQWQFSSDAEGWFATFESGMRRVVLREHGGQMRVDLQLAGSADLHPLAAVDLTNNSPSPAGVMHAGIALGQFMQKLQQLAQCVDKTATSGLA